MILNINFVEAQDLSIEIDEIKKLLEVDFHEMANKSSLIETFEEYKKNTFKIITSPKKVMFKTLHINTNLIYKVNKEKGMLQIISDETIPLGTDGCNLKLDCKVRVIKKTEKETTIAVKVNCDVDFGLNKMVNKSIRSFVEKEIKKVINSGIKKYNP